MYFCAQLTAGLLSPLILCSSEWPGFKNRVRGDRRTPSGVRKSDCAFRAALNQNPDVNTCTSCNCVDTSRSQRIYEYEPVLDSFELYEYKL